MSATYHATMVAADATTDEVKAVTAIDSSTVQSKALSLSRIAHTHKIAFGRSVL
jgi:hypothetical protein